MHFDTTSIIQVARYKYKEETHVKKHCHNFYHLIYIVGGQGVLHIQNEGFQSVENDLFLIQPGVFHEIISDASQPLFTLEVKFITTDAELRDNLSLLPLPFNHDCINLKTMLNHLVEEAINKSRFYKEVITLHFMEMLYQLIRVNESNLTKEEIWQSDIAFSEDNSSRELANSILKYIHRHYMEQITLTDIAAVFNIGLTYICRIFVKKYKISPIQYVNNLKLQKVKEFLSGTDRSITEISELVGFSSIHYLSRYFSAKEKMTPQEYRKRTKNAIHLGVEEEYKIINYMVDLN